jgi:hypothetical protein
MSKLIEIEVRSVYGNDLIYPVNEAAKVLANIAGKKTLLHGAHDCYSSPPLQSGFFTSHRSPP